ncbi:MAG: uridine kinase family protein [Saprospiraceae bacterium]|jgi:uridine kinase
MNKPLIVGITGGSGSGKTTFVKKLRERFSEDELCIVSQDEYYKPKERQQADDLGVINFDLPDSIDKQAFRRDILTLISGTPVHKKEYTFNNPTASARELVFKPAPIILVEGIFVLHFRRIRSLMDLKVFLYAKENLKVIRRIKRDQKERNYDLEDVLYRYEHHVLPAFERYVKPYIGEADIVINNNHDLELGIAVISGYLRNFLQEMPQNC